MFDIFVRIKCLWFSGNACIFKFHYTGEGALLPSQTLPHHFSKWNLTLEIRHFYDENWGFKPSFFANPSHRSLSFSSSGLTTGIPGFPRLFTVNSEHIRFYFLVFLFFSFQLSVTCGRWNWIMSAFERTLKYHLSYCIVQYQVRLTITHGCNARRSTRNQKLKKWKTEKK